MTWFAALREQWLERKAAVGEDGTTFFRADANAVAPHLLELARRCRRATASIDELAHQFQLQALDRLASVLPPASSCSGVLLSRPGFFRGFRLENGCLGTALDASSFPFIVEEFVAHGAGYVAIPDDNAGSVDLMGHPELYPCSVSVIETARAKELRASFLAEAQEEANVRIEGGAFLCNGSEATERTMSFVRVAMDLEIFLLAVENQLILDVDLNDFVRKVAVLRRSLRGPLARGKLAKLEAVLRGYCVRPITGLGVRYSQHPDFSTRIATLLGTAEYQGFSSTVIELGRPDVQGAALRRIAEAATKVEALAVDVSIAQHRFGLGRSLSEVEPPEVLPGAFVPPVLDGEALYRKSLASYLQARPDFRHVSNIEASPSDFLPWSDPGAVDLTLMPRPVRRRPGKAPAKGARRSTTRGHH